MRLVQLAELKEVISEDRLVEFFRAALASTFPPMSVKEICRTLEVKGSLQAVFDHYADSNVRLDLSINKLDPNRYEINFGSMGASLDDGGMWAVEYDEQDKVLSLEQPGYWVGRRTV